MSVRIISGGSKALSAALTKGPALVDFWATWCPPCKAISPVFEQLARENPSVQFLKVDVDAEPEIAESCGIQAMPTFHAYKDGKKVSQLVGADPTKLKGLLKAIE